MADAPGRQRAFCAARLAEIFFGLLLMGGGFMLLALNARHGAADGQASMGMMVAGLAMMGFAELFIDPVAMAQITRRTCPASPGVDRDLCWPPARWPTGWRAWSPSKPPNRNQRYGDCRLSAFLRADGRMDLGCVAVMVIIAFAAACSVGKRRAAAGEITGGGADARPGSWRKHLSGPRFVAPVSAARPGHTSTAEREVAPCTA